MKHMYLSENGKQYTTEEEALKADEEFREAEKVKSLEKANISKEKKELSDKIKAAENSVKEAEKNYTLAKEKAAEILQKANDEAEKILKESLLKVSDAKEERMLAIKAFNDKFGAYTTTYMGDSALEEYKRFVKEAFSPFFKGFWF